MASEKRVSVELCLIELSEVVRLGVALAVEDVRGLSVDETELREGLETDTLHLTEQLEVAAKEIGEAAAKMRAYCDANPPSEEG